MRPWYLFKLYILMTTIDIDYKSKYRRRAPFTDLPQANRRQPTLESLHFGEFQSSM